MDATHATVRNNFINTNRTSIKFKILTIFYKIVQLFTLLDFGFFNYKTKNEKLIRKSLIVLQLVIYCVVCYITVDYRFCMNGLDKNVTTAQNIYFSVHAPSLLLFYCANVLYLLSIDQNNNVYTLFQDLEVIDSELQVNVSHYNIEIKLLAANLVHVLFKSSITSFIKAWCKPIYYFNIVCYTLLQEVLMVHIFAIYAINCRLSELAKVLKANTPDKMFPFQIIYKNIVDRLESFKAAFDPLILASLAFGIPQLMFQMYISVEKFFKTDVPTYGYHTTIQSFSTIIVIAERTFILFLPAISASNLETQVGKIKLALRNKINRTPDEEIRRDVEAFIAYVEARNCRLRLYRVLPFDAELPVILLKFCITYLIVIVQFASK